MYIWKLDGAIFLCALAVFLSVSVLQTKILNSTSLCRSTLRTWRRSPGCWLQPVSLQTEWSLSLLHPSTNRPGRKSASWKVLFLAFIFSHASIFTPTTLCSRLHRVDFCCCLYQEVLSIVSTLWRGSMPRRVCRLPVTVVPMSWTCGH